MTAKPNPALEGHVTLISILLYLRSIHVIDYYFLPKVCQAMYQ